MRSQCRSRRDLGLTSQNKPFFWVKGHFLRLTQPCPRDASIPSFLANHSQALIIFRSELPRFGYSLQSALKPVAECAPAASPTSPIFQSYSLNLGPLHPFRRCAARAVVSLSSQVSLLVVHYRYSQLSNLLALSNHWCRSLPSALSSAGS